jgi:hypothetical protein
MRSGVSSRARGLGGRGRPRGSAAAAYGNTDYLLYLQQQQQAAAVAAAAAAAAGGGGDYGRLGLSTSGSAAALLSSGGGGSMDDSDSGGGSSIDEQFFTEAYPGKLCAFCNLSERSFLGQGDMVRYTASSEVNLAEFEEKRKAALEAAEGASGDSSDLSAGGGRKSPSNPIRRKMRKFTVSGDQGDPPDELDMIGYQDEVTDITLVFESGVFYAHFNCALWSGGVSSSSKGEPTPEKSGGGGSASPTPPSSSKEAATPLLRFVSRAVLNGLVTRCAHCRHYGATVPCKASERMYHWPCAVASGAWLDKASLTMVSVEAYDKVAGLASNAAYLYYMGDQWKIGKVAEIPPTKLRKATPFFACNDFFVIFCVFCTGNFPWIYIKIYQSVITCSF